MGSTIEPTGRVAELLREAKLIAPPTIPILSKLTAENFTASQDELAASRSLLVDQRKSDVGYKPPKEKKHYIFKDERWKKGKADTETWVFTKDEVAKAFHSLLQNAPLQSPGTAYALLSHIAPTNLDEGRSHLFVKKLEKKIPRRFFAKSSPSEMTIDPQWLIKVTKLNYVEYIRLMCQAGVAQDDLNTAFSVALSNRSIEAMTVLLSAGVIVSSHQEAVKEYVKQDDSEVINLLLSFPGAMSIEAWRLCLEPQFQNPSPLILLQCLTNCPDIACVDLLLKSLATSDFTSTAVILAYAPQPTDEYFLNTLPLACELLSCVESDEVRLKFFRIFGKAGYLKDALILRKKLVEAVKCRQIPLMQILVDAGVNMDTDLHHSVNTAVAQMDLEMLKVLVKAVSTAPVSPKLDLVPEETSEADVLQLLNILKGMPLAGEPLDVQLVRAVRKQRTELVEVLLTLGASVEHQHALPIRTTLKQCNLVLFETLLKHECSPNLLSAAIPDAMALRPRSVRLKAMQQLTKKGVVARALGVPLQILAAEDDLIDFDLVHLILRHNAPIDGVGDRKNNAVFVATQRGSLEFLRCICDVNPSKQTLSDALRIAFDAAHTHTYEVVFKMIQLLLQHGVTDDAMNQILPEVVTWDKSLRIVRLLIENGADANYWFAASFDAAIRSANLELLELLCTGHPPSSTTTRSLLPLATDPSHFDLKVLELLLSSTPAVNTVLNTAWASGNHKGNPNIVQIMGCFLRHGMNVNLGDGTLLCFAIDELRSDLLNVLISANPNQTSLKVAFQKTTGIKDRLLKRLLQRSLLQEAKSVEIGQSAELVLETDYAIDNDLSIFELLLVHKADVNFADGRAVQKAAKAGSLGVLKALLAFHPTLPTIHCACMVAAISRITSSDRKEAVLKCLLDIDSAVTGEGLSQILAVSVATLPGYSQLPEMLLARGAKVDFGILKVASMISSQALFTVLANRVVNSYVILELFRFTRDTKMAYLRKYWLYTYLLSKNIPRDDISEALLKTLTNETVGDISIAKLFLDHGASLQHKNGAALSLVFNLNLSETVDILRRYITNDQTANIAFRLARRNSSMESTLRFGVYECLLAWPIEISHVQAALRESIQDRSQDSNIIALLLENKADPNEDEARCFVLASTKESEDKLRTISRLGNPNLPLILRALVKHFEEERQVVSWFSFCLGGNSDAKPFRQDQLLFECIRAFPEGTTLLEMILDRGVSPSAKITTRLCPGWEPEVCTAVIWALCSSKPRVGNDPILTLLARGGKRALPAFSTPLSRLSAAFACVLDEERTDILKALISLDKTGVTQHTMLESKFAYLATHPKVDNISNLDESTNELSLQTASIYTGNFKAFQLMSREKKVDEGTLHMAAILALPKFVSWLLANGHDPNLRTEETGPMIPLALVCQAKYVATCKVANREAELLSRQTEVMSLLAAKTKSTWTYRGKTVLHYALEEGPEVTRAMIAALKVAQDKDRDEKYLYIDREGIHYSPDQYVQRIMDISLREKNQLVEVLKGCHMMSGTPWT